MAPFLHSSIVGSSSSAAAPSTRKDSVLRAKRGDGVATTLATKTLLWPSQPTPFRSSRASITVPTLCGDLDASGGGSNNKNACSSSAKAILDPLAALREDDTIQEAFAYPGSQPPPQQHLLPQDFFDGTVLILLPPTNQTERSSRNKSATMKHRHGGSFGKPNSNSGSAPPGAVRSSKSDPTSAGA